LLCQREGTNHILHLLVSVLLCGMWLIPWALFSVIKGPWRCSVCGSTGVYGIDRTSNAFLVIGGALVGTLALAGGSVALMAALGVAIMPSTTATPRGRPTTSAPAPAVQQPEAAQQSDAPGGEDLAEYRANLGKTAFNKTNGAEQGRIEDVGYAKVKGEGRVVVYKVRYHGALRDSPADNVEVRDVPSTVAE
jgi:hypothetical protein